ncbi:ATP-binding cassette domain-containing protein, partial [Planomonospora algeriensis]
MLAASGISKRFGAVQALSGVDFHVCPGEVVALVGDNGAGKSTLVKVLAGVEPADTGQVRWEGRPVTVTRPHHAAELGIATVYQDLSLCANLDVVANLFLGHEPVRGGFLDEIAMERQAAELLASFSVRLPDLRVPVSQLSGGQRQTVAIARSLLGDPKVILLDEPVAALGVAQVAHVLDLIEAMRDRGLGVVFISHNLADVRAVADRIVVLRLGHNAGDFRADEAGQDRIVAAITGASGRTARRRTARRGRAGCA